MTPHKIFITGIPTSGKSYLAKQLAEKTRGLAVLLDDFRDELAGESEVYKKWTNFYLDQDETLYYTHITPEESWNGLVRQSEGLWPGFLKKIDSYRNENRPVIFECVNLLPHLAHRDLKFPGVCLVGRSYEETLARNKKDPRWGKSPELQELEAKEFFFMDRPRYREESEKYGYPIFIGADEAFNKAYELLMGDSK